MRTTYQNFFFVIFVTEKSHFGEDSSGDTQISIKVQETPKKVIFRDKNDQKKVLLGRTQKKIYVDVDIGIIFFEKNLESSKKCFSAPL